MIKPELLAILCCPEARQPLRLAEASLVQELNLRVEQGILRNLGGRPVNRTLDAALVRADGTVCYPVFQGLPILLVEEGIALSINPAKAR